VTGSNQGERTFDKFESYTLIFYMNEEKMGEEN
jgi:hypothetical protein